MNFLSWFTPEYWLTMEHPEGWATLLGGLVGSVGTLLSVTVAALLTYLYTRRHSWVTHNTQVKVDRLKRDINALEQLWQLLAYMSFAESECAIVRWREKRDGKKEYFIHYGQLKRFVLQEVSKTFYQRHAGLFIPSEIRDQIFEYQGSLMGLYLRYEHDPNVTDESLIKIKNHQLVEKLRQAYKKLNNDLKCELNYHYQQLKI